MRSFYEPVANKEAALWADKAWLITFWKLRNQDVNIDIVFLQLKYY